MGVPVAKYAGQVINDVGISPKFGEKLPLDVTFVDAEGKSVRLGDLFRRQARDLAPRLLRMPDAVQAVGRRAV